MNESANRKTGNNIIELTGRYTICRDPEERGEPGNVIIEENLM